MSIERAAYLGPKLRRLRRDLGLTQPGMAADLGVSVSYVSLLESNQRPLTADMLLRLARTYKIDMSDFAGDGGAEFTSRLQSALRDPLFADIDLPALQA
ncbi:MAG: family transcriptional regulator, partial [Sphingomonas bacterium]|nr:family transcriptional regulator [Sphingomonas bacterium]